MKGRTERCMQADQHGRPAEPGQQSGQWGSVWIAARWRRRSLGEGGVAGGDAGAGHVNKFGMGADLISVAGLGCSGSDRRCVLVHRVRRDATARRASVSSRSGWRCTGPVCIGSDLVRCALARCVCRCRFNSQLGTDSFDFRTQSGSARRPAGSESADLIAQTKPTLHLILESSELACRDGGKLIFKR